ncbi:MAG: glycosyltransferase, partial [bacterium]
MKVALNVRSFENRGGIGRYARALAQNLIAHYPDDFFYLFSNSDTDISFLPPGKNWKFVPLGGFSNRLLWERYSLAKAVNDLKPDIFHNPDYTVPHRIKAPCVVTVHDLSFKYFPGGVSLKARVLYNALTPQSVRKARLVIADSKFTKNEIIRAGWKSKSDIRVVHPGVNDTYFDQVPDDELNLVMK